MKRLALPVLLLLPLASPHAARAQGPEHFENLKVLPKNIPRDSLLTVMRGFTQALGVRCGFCHAAVKNSEGRDSLVFKLDDKPEKRTARFMMRMVHDLDTKVLPDIPKKSDPPVMVRCVTCHRGSPLPRTIDQVVALAIDSAGVQAGLQRYRQLRQETMEQGRYDFSEGPVGDLAGRLAEQGKTADAIALLEMNQEFHPASAGIDVQLGDVYLRTGDREKAATYYRAALEKQPNNPMARRRLQELTGGTPQR
jgi:tetratricopeptide (TPR) repeat protein